MTRDEAIELVADYYDAIIARQEAVFRKEPPFDAGSLSPREILDSAVYKTEVAASELLVILLTRVD